MENSINRRQEGHRPVATPPPPHPPADFVYCGNTVPAVAAAAIAAPLSAEIFFKGLELAMVHLPEAAPLLLNAYKNEMAPGHGLAQLYQILEGGDFRNLPTASALQTDLNLYCMADAATDKALVHDTLTLLTKQIPGLLAAPAVHPEVILKVAEVGRALLNVHQYISNNRANLEPQLTLDHLTPLLSLFTQASTRTGRGARLVPTRDRVAVKHAELTQAEVRNAINTIRSYGGRALENMNPRLKSNRDFVMEAVSLDGRAFEFVSEELQDDPDVVLAAVASRGWVFEFASERIRNDPVHVMAAVRLYGYALQYTNQSLQHNPEILMAAVQNDGLALRFGPAECRKNKSFAMAAVQSCGFVFRSLSEKLRNDPDIATAAYRQTYHAAKHLGEDLKNNTKFVISLLQIDRSGFDYFPPQMLGKPEIAALGFRPIDYSSDD